VLKKMAARCFIALDSCLTRELPLLTHGLLTICLLHRNLSKRLHFYCRRSSRSFSSIPQEFLKGVENILYLSIKDSLKSHSKADSTCDIGLLN